MKKSLLFIALASGVAAPMAIATEKTATLDTVVVNANRLPQEIDDVYSAVSVVTREDIERLQPASLPALLATIPGVGITQSGGKGSLSGLFIRGTKSAQSLVLVDGIRSASAASGTTPLETLSVDQIERIEIIRGARSTVYGADAIGGVISIYTRTAKGAGVTPYASVRYGSHDAWERNVGVGAANATSRINLNVASEEVTGHNRSRSQEAANLDKDAYRNHSVSVNGQHRFSDDVALSGSYLYQEGETEYDFGYAGAYPYDEFSLQNVSVALDAAITSRWATRIEVGTNDNDNRNLFDDDATVSFFDTSRTQYAWINRFTTDAAGEWQVGADGYSETLNGSIDLAETSRDNQAGFANYRYQQTRWGVEAGVRYDDNDIYGDFTTANAGASVFVTEKDKLFVTYSEGFRAPSFSDLYYPGYSNASLTPETSESIEVKWAHRVSPTSSVEVAAYQTDIDDAIVNDQFWIPQNIGRVESSGAEVTATTRVGEWTLLANASYVDARDASNDLMLNHRAKKAARIEASRQYGRYTLSTDVRGQGASWDDAANTRKIAGYALWNARARVALAHDVELGVSVDNILDKRYETALNGEGWPAVYNGYREWGRTASLSITWKPQR